jgi:hypothetical protein
MFGISRSSVSSLLRGLPLKFSLSLVISLTPIASQASESICSEQVGEHFGVKPKVTPDGCLFTIALNDQELVIEKTALDQDALRSTWSRLEDLVARKERELECAYQIRLGHDGDLTTGDGYGQFSKRTYSVRVRSAKLGELYGLEYALAHSVPSQLTEKNGSVRGVHVYFLKERRTCGVIAEWGYDRDNQPAVFIEPHYQDTAKGKRLELVLIHELAHNAEVKMGLDPYHPESWSLARALGWLAFANPETGETGWLLSSKESANGFYKFAKLSGLWVHCNRNGQPLAQNGAVVERQIDARRLTPQQMMEVAAVRPATPYFPNPMEMVAEGIMMLRADRTCRRQLMITNTRLYDLLKAQDQAEIERFCASQRCVRTPDGVLAVDNLAADKELSEFEASAIASDVLQTQETSRARLASVNGDWE